MALLVVRSMRRALGVVAGELSLVQERTMLVNFICPRCGTVTPPFTPHPCRQSVCGHAAHDSRYGTCTRDPGHIGIHENALAWWDGRGNGGFRGPLAGEIDDPPQPKGAPLTPKGRAIEIIDKAREHQLRLAEHLRSQARELEGAARDHEATAEELRMAAGALELAR